MNYDILFFIYQFMILLLLIAIPAIVIIKVVKWFLKTAKSIF